MNAELRKKLRRRSSLEEYSGHSKRELKTSTWIMDLSEFGKFDKRENIINFGCVHHSLTSMPATYTSTAF